MHIVYLVTSLDDLALHKAGEDGATQKRQSPVTVRTSPGRYLAESQLDTLRALSSRWVSARVKVSGSDYCEETTKQLVGGHQTKKRHGV